MDIKLLTSKINMLEAQIKQFETSPLFSKTEAESITKPYREMLLDYKKQKADLINKPLSEIEVINPEVIKVQ